MPSERDDPPSISDEVYDESRYTPEVRRIMDENDQQRTATEPPSISDWLRMHADQTTQQATLVVPSWAKHRLDVMSPGMRQSIMEELDAIASQYGLATPVVIVEAEDG